MNNDSIDSKRNAAKKYELAKIRKTSRKMMCFSILSVLTVVLAWQAVVTFELVETRFVASPLQIIETIMTKAVTKKPDGSLLYQHIIDSAMVVWLGFGAGAVIGIALGLFMGWFRFFDRMMRPLFEIVRPIPSLAWIPIILLFLGIGIEARAAIIFFGSFVSVCVNTYAGIRSTNPVLINVAKTCGAGNFKIFYKVGIPSSLPLMFAGLKTCMGASWGTVVAAEMLAASRGLGYMMQFGRQYGEVELIMSGIIVIGICGLISSFLVQLAETAVLKWRA